MVVHFRHTNTEACWQLAQCVTPWNGRKCIRCNESVYVRTEFTRHVSVSDVNEEKRIERHCAALFHPGPASVSERVSRV